MYKPYSYLMLGILCLAGCSPASKPMRQTIADDLKKQTGFEINKEKKAGAIDLPPAVQPQDGLNEEEAVTMALWNNASFQADLVSVKLSEADVVDAKLIANPVLRYLAPSGGISASGYINFGLDFLFQRPKRIAGASAELNRVTAAVTQKGFTLIRDVQLAYADVLLANEKSRIYRENAQIRKEMAELANSRLRAGDISELETTTFRADSAAAADDLTKAKLDSLLKKNIFNALLGLSPDTTLQLQTPLFVTDTQRIVAENYLTLASTYQPDTKAAQLAIESAAKRLGWERSRILTFTATLNFQHLPNNGGGKALPNGANPGVQLELPVFNRNQGKIARAQADLDLATFQYISAIQRISLDAANALDQYEQSWASFNIWEKDVLQPWRETVRLSQSSYRNGDISYLPVLEANRQLLNAELRRAELRAAIKRAISQLNFLIGN